MGRMGSPSNGQCAIVVFDGDDTAYTEVYDHLNTAGNWPATAGVMTRDLGSANQLTNAMCQTMASVSEWDIIPHGREAGNDFDDGSWTEVTLRAAFTEMQQTIQALNLATNGYRTIAPSGSVDATGYAVAREMYRWVMDQLGQNHLYPKESRWTWAWESCADVNPLVNVQNAINALIGFPLKILLLTFHRIVPSGAVGTQSSHARLIDVINAITAADVTKTTFSLLDETNRTVLTPFTMLGPGSDWYTAGAADVALTAADAQFGNAWYGRKGDLLIARDSGLASRSMTLSQAVDPLSRPRDLVYTLHSGDIAAFGPIALEGWAQADGLCYIDAAMPDVLLKVLRPLKRF